LPLRAWNTLWDYVRRVWLAQGEDNVFFLAAGIAFNLLLVVLPFVLLVIAGLAIILRRTAAASIAEVHQVLDVLLPPHAEGLSSPIHNLLDDLIRGRGTVGIYAAVGFTLFSTRIFGTLRSALSEVFDIEQPRGVISAKLIDLAMTVATTALAMAYLALSGYLVIATPRGVDFLAQLGIRATAIGGLARVIGRALEMAFLLAIFYALYRYLPNRKIRWRAALLGACAATVLFEIARNLYLAYISAFHANSLYTGTVFAIVSIVGWVYYGAVIFLLGGEVAQAHEVRRVIRLHREMFG
jgi:membrane protein